MPITYLDGEERLEALINLCPSWRWDWPHGKATEREVKPTFIPSFIINKNTLKKLRAFLGSDQEILGMHLDVSKGTRPVFHKGAWEAITGDLQKNQELT